MSVRVEPVHSEYNTQEHTAILHMRNKNALMKYGNERASNYEINFSFDLKGGEK